MNYYRLVHNVTNNDINITVIVPSPTTTLTITGASVNFTYFVQLEANNTLGFGPATVTNIGKYINIVQVVICMKFSTNFNITQLTTTIIPIST